MTPMGKLVFQVTGAFAEFERVSNEGRGLRYVRIQLHVTDIDALIRMKLLKED